MTWRQSTSTSRHQRPISQTANGSPTELIDRWAETAALAEPEARRSRSGQLGRPRLPPRVTPASIQELYLARAAGKWSGRTVPAMNLRGWTYHTCRAVFRAAREMDAQLFIFEQAVGESSYAEQPSRRIHGGRPRGGAPRGLHGARSSFRRDHDPVDANALSEGRGAEIQRLETSSASRSRPASTISTSTPRRWSTCPCRP